MYDLVCICIVHSIAVFADCVVAWIVYQKYMQHSRKRKGTKGISNHKQKLQKPNTPSVGYSCIFLQYGTWHQYTHRIPPFTESDVCFLYCIELACHFSFMQGYSQNDIAASISGWDFRMARDREKEGGDDSDIESLFMRGSWWTSAVRLRLHILS